MHLLYFLWADQRVQQCYIICHEVSGGGYNYGWVVVDVMLAIWYAAINICMVAL